MLNLWLNNNYKKDNLIVKQLLNEYVKFFADDRFLFFKSTASEVLTVVE